MEEKRGSIIEGIGGIIDIDRINEIEITPELIEAVKEGLGGKETIREMERVVLREIAKGEEGVEGFAAYYELLKGNELPRHCREWIEEIYKLEGEDYDGLLNFAYRGSWKSTTLSVVYTSYVIGKHPEGTVVVVSANEANANNITNAIAEIIERSEEFKLVFPGVVPYKERGWGALGYWVKDERVSNEDWLKRTAGMIDPTFIAGGVDSAKLIGKHPSLLLILDDVHDENNSASVIERERVKKKVSDTILPMAIKEIDKRSGRRKIVTKTIVIGTPWDEDDAYHYLLKTGQFKHTNTPVMRPAEEGEEGAVYFDGHRRDGQVCSDIIGWWKITSPGMYNKEAIMAERAKSGQRGFARMFLLDLKKSNESGLKYYTYPHEQIDLNNWALYGGVDFATVIQKTANEQPGRDRFSMAYGAKTPTNKLIVFDGIIEQCTQAQAEDHMKKPQMIFPNWHSTVIEGDGIGEQFWIGLMARNPGLRVLMKKTGGVPKMRRQEMELGVWLERGMILISDADTPYLNALRKALDEFPDGNNDIRDGVYWLGRAVPEIFVSVNDYEGMPEGGLFERGKNRNRELRLQIAKAIGGRQ